MLQPTATRHRALERYRTALLLAVYLLFAVLPGAHLLWHDHGTPHHAGGAAQASLVPACGAHCGDPHHHHDDHDADSCPVCQLLGAWKGAPLPPRAAALAPPHRTLPARQSVPPASAGMRALPRPRGPPGLAS